MEREGKKGGDSPKVPSKDMEQPAKVRTTDTYTAGSNMYDSAPLRLSKALCPFSP